MMRKLIVPIAWIAVAAITQAQGNLCGRACLNDLMTKFLNSVVAHDSTQTPVLRADPVADRIR